MDQKKARAERFKIPVVLTDQQKKAARAERFNIVSEQQKRDKRADRFGLHAEEKKREARAARFGIVSEEQKREARAARFGTGQKKTKTVGFFTDGGDGDEYVDAVVMTERASKKQKMGDESDGTLLLPKDEIMKRLERGGQNTQETDKLKAMLRKYRFQ
mmetsp:Transcript_15159/g.21928  ORF Transcript_15159/g.21928 Transcript_15159/m.21928 type:complete len:159 (-) Transcript_15159:161-637(-)